MLSQEIKTIYRNGIRFLNTFYYSDKLYGLRTQVIIKYSLFDLTQIRVYTTANQFICTAKRITETHPMAYHLGDVYDMEDFKQKIQKQRKLKNKTLKAVQKFLPKEDLKFIETQMNKEVLEDVPAKQIKVKKPIQRQEQMSKPIFLNNQDKFAWLMKNGCTNADDRNWLAEYKQSGEYKSLYE
jgi:hypothetical protein